MTIQESIKKFRKEKCPLCANKKTDKCHITCANGITKCIYFVNEELQNCMQKECKTCKRESRCFKI